MPAYQSLVKHSIFLVASLSGAAQPARSLYRGSRSRDRRLPRSQRQHARLPARTGGAPSESLASAMSIAPDDKAIRGKYQPDQRLICAPDRRNLKECAQRFRGVRAVCCPIRPIRTSGSRSDSDEREQPRSGRRRIAQGRAKRFPSRAAENREPGGWISQRAANDGSPKRSRAQGIAQMQDALKHADSDLAHAQELYNSVAPFSQRSAAGRAGVSRARQGREDPGRSPAGHTRPEGTPHANARLLSAGIAEGGTGFSLCAAGVMAVTRSTIASEARARAPAWLRSRRAPWRSPELALAAAGRPDRLRRLGARLHRQSPPLDHARARP